MSDICSVLERSIIVPAFSQKQIDLLQTCWNHNLSLTTAWYNLFPSCPVGWCCPSAVCPAPEQCCAGSSDLHRKDPSPGGSLLPFFPYKEKIYKGQDSPHPAVWIGCIWYLPWLSLLARGLQSRFSDLTSLAGPEDSSFKLLHVEVASFFCRLHPRLLCETQVSPGKHHDV